MSPEQTFIDTIDDNLLHQFIDLPTRDENILDLAFAGDVSAVQEYDVIHPLGNSDHNIVSFSLKCLIPRIERAPRKVFLYSKGDYDSMNHDLKETDWQNILKSKNLNENWLAFKNEYQINIDKYIPSKLVKPGQRNSFPWVRYKSVKKAKAKHRKAQVYARTNGLGVDQLIADDRKREVDEAVYNAKVHYESKLVSQVKDNPKRFYNYARHFTRSSGTVEVLEQNDRKITDDTQKADILNDFFCSVLTDETPVDSSHNVKDNNPPKHILRDIDITVEDVRKKLSKLKPNKASGPDGISVNVLRNCLEFDVPLQMIFSQSLTTGITPQDWRDANVSPLFKKGSRSKCNNYRPVSLTSQIVKLLERIVYDHLYNLLKLNGTISCHQHGFQGQCSCVTQLLECMQDWTMDSEQGLQTDIIYFDFAKAFDTVPHKRLLLELKKTVVSEAEC